MNNIDKYDSSDDQYPHFSDAIKERFSTFSSKPLFTTDSENLFEVFLNNLPDHAKQHYNCSCCRYFLNRFGGLVSISDDGEMSSVLWDEHNTPEFFLESVKSLKQIALKSKVTGVFVSSHDVLGYPMTNGWYHMSVALPVDQIHNSRLKTAGQIIAEKKEDFRILNAGLVEYPLDAVDQAVTLLESESLYRSDRVLGVAKFLRDLHNNRLQTDNNQNRDNITWLAVATAPSGFCHVKSSMIGTLLDDIVNGLSIDSITRRFAEKMNPASYMRAQSAPTQGNIEQAEKIVEKLGIANSLKRRYATFEEVPHFIWKSKENVKKDAQKSGGVFANITPKEQNTFNNVMNLPNTVMTWDKFQRTVLPSADSIEVMVDNPNRFMALVTATDQEAPNILQWNNSFSWYYHGGIDGEIKRRVESAGGQYEGNEIRCSLIWEGYTDLDLHCITPNGEHIYYGDKSRGNGWLDIDMNGGAHRDFLPVENIRWSHGYAPIGNYRFYVHNYCERGKGITPFKVELEVNGKVYSYHGVAGGEGYRSDVFKFHYERGKQPDISSSNYSSEDAWNIATGSFTKVNGITISPNMWGEDPVSHSGNHIFFLLEGCKDSSEGKGRGFFVESLKSDLREIRKTLEAYTANTPIENVDQASACGLGYSKDSEWNLVLKLTSNKSTRIIKIDRWD
ncbi:hypothetical protein BRE01_67350 [Brevibacillus reuszeri]|nr:hypothetical protein [Brevibacillus reuszeri]GED73033.1 hypothetical protein BRE01_67350 [Brevibacillus reuszeri]